MYNASCRHFERHNWTLAHEIGHIYLGHTEDNNTEEVEAHFFASQLFMPEYSLFMMKKEYGCVDVKALTEIFGVSEDAAARRIRTMSRKYSVRTTQKDKEIWESQRERIDMYYGCLKDGSDYRNTLYFWNQMKADYERQCRLDAYSQVR